MNTFGRIFRLTTFGESHGPAIGGIIDGCPPRLQLDLGLLREMLDARRPGASPDVSARNEPDMPEFLSGLSEDGLTLGTPIGFIIRNKDRISKDYDELAHIYRPNHADFTYEARYGIREHRGGGRASARETANRVVGGAVALSWLHTLGIEVKAELTAVGDVSGDYDLMMKKVREVRAAGDSVGGIVECYATGLPPGIGNPVFGKLHAVIADALMSINGVKGIEYGDGFRAAQMLGSQHADAMASSGNGGIQFLSNHSGGIQGGISNGMPVQFRVAFKPTPTITAPLQSVSDRGENVTLRAAGRHDPCIAVRGTVVCRAMMALALADSILLSRLV